MVFHPPSDEEKAVIESLKLKLKEDNIDHSLTDLTLLRFYRGRKKNFDKAINGIIKHLEWRKENEVDHPGISPESIQKEVSANKIITSGKDKKGSSLVTVIAKNHDKDNRDINEIKRFIIYNIETAVKTTNPDTEQLVIVFDLEQFGYYCMDYEVVKMLINILEFNYPETLDCALIVNAPFVFSACWMVIKPWLDPITAAKCTFINKADLKHHIDETSQLPSHLVH